MEPVHDLLERFKKTDSPDKDLEAETLIRQTMADQSDAYGPHRDPLSDVQRKRGNEDDDR